MKGIKKTGIVKKARLTKKSGKKLRLKNTSGIPALNRSKNKKPVKVKNKLFPVVAIGASAGGIEAISKLLENLSPDLGMAYVIIQHLAPNHKSILPELLERKTEMPVHQVKHNMHILPDNIYVIPPNTYMSIEDSKLKLSPRIKTDGSFHSIDYFLEALGPIYKNKAIAIILSGSASDGTMGIRAIKVHGGITFAQDKSAKFPGMPQNAVDSGFTDFILSPLKIAQQLKAFPRIIHSIASNGNGSEIKMSEQESKKIHSLLYNKRHVDFSNYKQSTINRRILRRMVLNRVTSTEDYIKLLQKKPDEIDLLYKDLLINVTNFFRDAASFVTLTKKIFPALVKGRKQNDPIRIWIPACSSGEEAYSTAICLFEFLKDKGGTTQIQIFATDLNEAAIEKARSGIYPKAAMENVSPQQLKKYFVKIDGSFQIIKPIRDVCIFATHDLLKDPPFSRMDLISCQNVMIYLESNPQKKMLQGFHYALKASGYLLLGKSETIGSSSELFTPVNKEQKIYAKKYSDLNSSFDFSLRSHFPINNAGENKKKALQESTVVNIDKEAERLLLSRYIPASVIVDKDLHILRFLGIASHYLQPVSGKASLHLLKMVRDDLVFDLRALLHRAKKENKPVKKEGITLSENGPAKELNLEVVPIKSTSRDPYYLILFKEVMYSTSTSQDQKGSGRNKKDIKNPEVNKLRHQLGETREQMKIMSEEFESTREELQSSNEEVLSSNEELQSINEEIETSKEELQSSNEELNTINEELERRNNELREAVDYSQAIVQTIDEPLIVLNADMHIKMANKAFYQNFKTRNDEVEGLNFFEIANYQWDIPELRRRLSEVFSKEKNFEQFELQHVFPLLGERILRLSATRLNRDDPQRPRLLLVLEDITRRKKAEWHLKENEERFRLLVQNASDIISILSPEGNITYESESVERILGYKPEERLGKNIFKDLIVHPDDMNLKISAFQKSILNSNEIVKTGFRLRHKNGGYRDIEAVYLNLLSNPRISGIVANYHDVTDQRKIENQREEFVSIASHELRTPVTSLKGYIQIIKDMLLASGDTLGSEILQKLNHQVDRLIALIKDLFDVTKIREGQLELNTSHFNINKLIDEVLVEMQLGAKKHLLVADLKAKKRVNADSERIGQVLRNLISNAIKFSPDTDEIIITSSSDEEKITVCVQDFGIGIDPEHQKKIFSRFFRINDDRLKNNAGLGLGLYISSEIIKHHKGTITVTSEKGKGSSFCFTIPVKYSG
ncbi:MAG TPA: CheR family methyltransferase [Chitinophagaceae bacterium]|nr:CheR family methyltransferase [Chitinophagaceae bacterium]